MAQVIKHYAHTFGIFTSKFLYHCRITCFMIHLYSREPVLTTAAEEVSGSTSRVLDYQKYPSTVDNLISTLSGNKTEV